MRFVTDLSKGILGQPDSTELWGEIISHIPDSVLLKPGVRILNVACGHGTEAVLIAKRMLALGISKEAVNDALYLIDKYNVFTNPLKVERGFKNVITADFLTWETDMKFDVVIGNPPYADPINDKRMLWNVFSDKAIEIAEYNGYIALVTPATWLTATSNIHNSYKLYETKQIEKAVIFDKEDKPFDEGTTVSYVIARNADSIKKAPLYYTQYSKKIETFVGNVDFTSEKVWPGQLTAINLSIHEKLLPFQKIIFLKSCEMHNQKLKKKNIVSDIKEGPYIYTHYVSAAITRYTSVKFSDYATWKVMVPVTSTIDKAVIDCNCGHGEDMLSLYVSDQQTAENIKTLFNTKFYKFIGRLYRNGRNQPLQNLFPVMDYTKVWTDAELYAHFNLTQEEIDYIEANVK